jgi:hypothetical protein
MAAGNCQERRRHPLGWHAPRCWRGHNSLAIIGMVLTSRFFRDDEIEQGRGPDWTGRGPDGKIEQVLEIAGLDRWTGWTGEISNFSRAPARAGARVHDV